MGFAGRKKIQALLRADADGSELIRCGDGFRSGGAVHRAGSEGHVPAFPVFEGRDRSAAKAELREARGEGYWWEFRRRVDQGRDSQAQAARADPQAPTTSLPSNGHDGTRCLETPARLA